MLKLDTNLFLPSTVSIVRHWSITQDMTAVVPNKTDLRKYSSKKCLDQCRVVALRSSVMCMNEDPCN